jgi:hypothetical protein
VVWNMRPSKPVPYMLGTSALIFLGVVLEAEGGGIYAPPKPREAHEFDLRGNVQWTSNLRETLGSDATISIK